jgi:integrase
VLPTGNIRDTRLSPEDELNLLNAAHNQVFKSAKTNPALYPWLEFVKATGCRPGEAAKTELTWLHLDKCYVDVPRRGTKKKTPRRVLVTQELVELLQAQRQRAIKAQSPYLFYSISRKTGLPVPYQYNTAWRKLRKETGIEIEPHGLRRELISRILEGPSGLSLSQTALLVGDVNVASLNPYSHLQAAAIRPQYEAFQVVQAQQRDLADRVRIKELLKQLGRDASNMTPEDLAALEEPLPKPEDPAEQRERHREHLKERVRARKFKKVG